MFVLQSFDSRSRAAQVLANDIASSLRDALEARGRATLVVSGGSSPLEMFSLLGEVDLNWARVVILPSDERWVDQEDPASNAGMLMRTLMAGRASAARLLSLYDESLAEHDIATALSSRLSELALPLDVVLLGMGGDGHTASLFPDDPDIAGALASTDHCVTARPPSQPLLRVSLTPNTLLNARQIKLLFFGQEKADVFSEAAEHGDLTEYPVRCVLRQERVPVTTYFAQ
ncbi:MAG: 6-phosphogluconolactonase [Pseudomonadota bacterium]